MLKILHKRVDFIIQLAWRAKPLWSRSQFVEDMLKRLHHSCSCLKGECSCVFPAATLVDIQLRRKVRNNKACFPVGASSLLTFVAVRSFQSGSEWQWAVCWNQRLSAGGVFRRLALILLSRNQASSCRWKSGWGGMVWKTRPSVSLSDSAELRLVSV